MGTARSDLTSSDRRYMASEEIDVALAAWAARKDVCAAAEVLVQAGVPAARSGPEIREGCSSTLSFGLGDSMRSPIIRSWGNS